MVLFVLYYTNALNVTFQCQLSKTTFQGQTLRYTLTHYPDVEPIILCSCHSLMLNISIVVGLTRTWLEPTIQHTQGKQANYYTTRHIIVNALRKKANIQHKKIKPNAIKVKKQKELASELHFRNLELNMSGMFYD